MSKIVFCDLNPGLVDEVSALPIRAVWGDYFAKVRAMERAGKKPVLMTASNPSFTFGGGIDAVFLKEFPDLCREKQERPGYNERIGNICFVITVDKHLHATKEKVKEAIQFALDSTKEDETLLIHGAGTGIGNLPNYVFVSLLKELVEA